MLHILVIVLLYNLKVYFEFQQRFKIQIPLGVEKKI